MPNQKKVIQISLGPTSQLSMFYTKLHSPIPELPLTNFLKFKSRLSLETNTSSLFKLSLRTLSFGIYRARPAWGDGNNKNYLYKWVRITWRHKFLLAQWELVQKIKGQRFLELCFCFIFKVGWLLVWSLLCWCCGLHTLSFSIRCWRFIGLKQKLQCSGVNSSLFN